jgi:hypothetical protein
MARFQGSTVERVHWDFQQTPKRNADTGLVEGKWLNGEDFAVGELPEPTDEAVDKYMSGMREIAEALDVTTLTDITDDQFSRGRTMLESMLVDLGVPEPLVVGLPPRHLRAFSTFLQGEVVGNGETAA